MMRSSLFIFLAFIIPSYSYASDAILNPTGLPVPRFVSLKSNEINVRVGPGTRYPISWVFTRKGYPVEIVEEFGHWRKIRDHEDSEGWVHRNLLSGKRTIATQRESTALYHLPEKAAPVIAQAAPMVIMTIKQCQLHWCEVGGAERTGWIKKNSVWGVYEAELISD